MICRKSFRMIHQPWYMRYQPGFETINWKFSYETWWKFYSLDWRWYCSLCAQLLYFFQRCDNDLFFNSLLHEDQNFFQKIILVYFLYFFILAPQTEVLFQISGVNDNNILQCYWSHLMFERSLAVCGRLV